MVSAQRLFEGRLELAELPRLAGLLADRKGEIAYRISFDRDAMQIAYATLEIEAALPLECQRSLESFELPVRIDQRIAFIRDEAEEAALPEGYEAWLVDASDVISPRDLIEDELILVVPAIPVKPGTEAMAAEWSPDEKEVAAANPFAALAALRRDQKE
ncbi:hypothetical protein Lysil_2446 [Lysobacter silvestris]|uniref:Large ribosomal RNA subunit accumulation protein YceD n=2 Tax=Solilutibacter silvestris TaxID=1645665 RepID=A0A2K1PZR2_9GAMM|nr:hypothetical protein Lysil_2446 [Lysobacter silvestris]